MKIYNEIVIDMNPESSSYGKALYEDSFEYSGDLMLMQGPPDQQTCEDQGGSWVIQIDKIDSEEGGAGVCVGLNLGPDETDTMPDFSGVNFDLSNNPYTQNVTKIPPIPITTDAMPDFSGVDFNLNLNQNVIPGSEGLDDLTIDPNALKSNDTGDDIDDDETLWDLAESGIGTEGWNLPEWYDDPETAGVDEFETYLYEVIGGGPGSGMGKDDWLEKYGGAFPEWEETDEYRQYQETLKLMGIADEKAELGEKDYQVSKAVLALQETAQGDLATEKGKELAFGVESQFLGGGGGISGRKISQTEQAFADVNRDLSLELTGIDLKRTALDIAYDTELLTIDEQTIKYEGDLVGLENQYSDNLDTLAADMNLSTAEECGNDASCTGAGMVCSPAGYCVPALQDVGGEDLADQILNATETDEYLAEYDYNQDGKVDVLDAVLGVSEGTVTDDSDESGSFLDEFYGDTLRGGDDWKDQYQGDENIRVGDDYYVWVGAIGGGDYQKVNQGAVEDDQYWYDTISVTKVFGND